MYEPYDNLVIHNVELLEEAFPPTRLLHREGQIDELAFHLKPALKKKLIGNIYIYGSPGTGKTAVTKWILENHFQDVSAYVNCFRFRTAREIVKEILFRFGYFAKETEETSDLLKKLETTTKRRRIIVCLDETDQVKISDRDEVLYNLIDAKCGLILISNKSPTQLYNLDQRVRDRLNLHSVEFPEYKVSELFDIAVDRVTFAFVPHSLSRDMIQLAAENSEGDARLMLLILKDAGKMAERRGSRKVEESEIMKGVLEARRLRKSKLLEKLNEHQKAIYNILEQSRKLPAGELYRRYCKSVKESVGTRAFRYYISHMCTLGLAKSIGVKKWRSYEIVV